MGRLNLSERRRSLAQSQSYSVDLEENAFQTASTTNNHKGWPSGKTSADHRFGSASYSSKRQSLMELDHNTVNPSATSISPSRQRDKDLEVEGENACSSLLAKDVSGGINATTPAKTSERGHSVPSEPSLCAPCASPRECAPVNQPSLGRAPQSRPVVKDSIALWHRNKMNRKVKCDQQKSGPKAGQSTTQPVATRTPQCQPDSRAPVSCPTLASSVDNECRAEEASRRWQYELSEDTIQEDDIEDVAPHVGSSDLRTLATRKSAKSQTQQALLRQFVQSLPVASTSAYQTPGRSRVRAETCGWSERQRGQSARVDSKSFDISPPPRAPLTVSPSKQLPSPQWDCIDLCNGENTSVAPKRVERQTRVNSILAGARQMHYPSEESDESPPWWHALADFVPVDCLSDGFDPRNGARVYVDYKNQFKQHDLQTTSCKRGTSTRAKALKNTSVKKSKTKTQSSDGHWDIEADGRRVFVLEDGETKYGKTAWNAYRAPKLQRKTKGGRKKGGKGKAKRGRN